MKLSDMLIKEVVKPVVYDKDYNVVVDFKYIPRSEVQAIMNRNTKIEFNKKTHKPEEVMDGEKLAKDMARTVIKGWKGMTYKFFSTIAAIDLSMVDNPDAEIEFNEEHLMLLIDNSYDFSTWILDTVRDAETFSKLKEVETKN